MHKICQKGTLIYNIEVVGAPKYYSEKAMPAPKSCTHNSFQGNSGFLIFPCWIKKKKNKVKKMKKQQQLTTHKTTTNLICTGQPKLMDSSSIPNALHGSILTFWEIY